MSDTDLPVLDSEDQLQVILHEPSPWGNIDAIVQHDYRCVYFYLLPRQTLSHFPAKACWVCNLIKGPLVINQNDLMSGRQVMLPRNQTRTPFPTADTTTISRLIPTVESLRIVWFEDGDGAALIQQADSDAGGPSQHTLAVIPAWSGLKGFHGYAADCASDSPICWPLPNNLRLQQRIERATQFWESFRRATDPFLDLRDRLIERYDQLLLPPDALQGEPQPMQPLSPPLKSGFQFEILKQYYDISGNQFPPRGLIEYRFKRGDRMGERVVLITVGMSLCCQPQVELDQEDPRIKRRIELGIELNLETSSLSPEYPAAGTIAGTDAGQKIEHQEKPKEHQSVSILNQARQELARLAAYPWRNFRWLGAGHTCQFFGVFPNSNSVRLMLQPVVDESNFVSSNTNEETPLQLISFRDDPITLLWLNDDGQM